MRQSSQQYSAQDAYAGIQPWTQVLDAAQHAHKTLDAWESRQFGFATDTNMDYPADIDRFADDGNPNVGEGE